MLKPFSVLLLVLFALPAAALELVMAERQGCGYCLKWKAEIAPIYPKTELGDAAPLRYYDIDKMEPDFELARPVIFTPTFLFVEDGKEVARLEGYQSDEFFWFLAEEIVENNAREIAE